MIYLDNNATTKPDMDALQFALNHTARNSTFGNPSSIHSLGRSASDKLAGVRADLADIMRCKPYELYYTSGGTEANNLALHQSPGEIFIGDTEHSSVFNYPGVKCIRVNEDGTIDLNHLEHLLNNAQQRGMVSLMLANNETGVISDPTGDARKLCHKYGFLLHVDAVQGFGKQGAPWNVQDIGADLVSISGHKIHGPKGIGALYVSENLTPLRPLLAGGNHERGLRPGTENIMGAIAMTYICKSYWKLGFDKYQEKLMETLWLRNRLEDRLDGVALINGNPYHRIGNTSNLYFPEIKDAELFVDTLSLKGLCVSGKSACSSGMPRPSRVLMAMYGDGNPRLEGSIRISLSTQTTDKEIDEAVDIIRDTIDELKDMF